MNRVLILLAVVVLARSVDACAVCVGRPLKVGFQDSRYFFVGKVVRQAQWNVTFQILEQFKGEPVAELTLQTSNSCWISNFKLAESYLVEATEDRGELFASLCSHTGPLSSPLMTRELDTVRSRARWWKSRLGRVSLHRLTRRCNVRQTPDAGKTESLRDRGR